MEDGTVESKLKRSPESPFTVERYSLSLFTREEGLRTKA